jgi:hypothetical protein
MAFCWASTAAVTAALNVDNAALMAAVFDPDRALP